MKIFELFDEQPLDSKLDFDLQDDLIFFMHNDPEFYRKEYYPIHRKFKKILDSERNVSAKAFAPLVKKAYSQYLNKFKEELPVEKLEEELQEKELEEICEKLLSFETEHYHKEKENQEKNNQEKEEE